MLIARGFRLAKQRRRPGGLASSFLHGLLGMAPAVTALAQSQTPQQLAPVAVSGTRIGTPPLETPASVDIVEGAAMRRGQPGINLSEGLAGVPGLQIQNRQNYAQDLQISSRGFGARSTFGVRGVRLYVDGIPATMPDGQGQTSNIDIGSLDRVEVLRGPFSALYGNSSGGVILAYTEDGAVPPEIGVSAWAGPDRTWRYGAKASGTSGDMDYVLDLSRMTTDGYRDHSAARKNLGNAKLGVQLDDASRLTIVANSVDLTAQDPLGLTYAQFQDAPRSAELAAQYDTRKTVRQTQGGLGLRTPRRRRQHAASDAVLRPARHHAVPGHPARGAGGADAGGRGDRPAPPLWRGRPALDLGTGAGGAAADAGRRLLV